MNPEHHMEELPRLKPPPEVKLLVSIMGGSKVYDLDTESEISRFWGPLDHRSVIYCFSGHSRHYEKEMGKPLWKYFLTFRDLAPAQRLVDLKLFLVDLERKRSVRQLQFSVGFSRTVNLDPGYLTGWNLVLATVKNRAHRLYLEQGVYGELTLVFRQGEFHPLPWTYPDYRLPELLAFFRDARQDYLTTSVG